jgi:hypothetical protein
MKHSSRCTHGLRRPAGVVRDHVVVDKETFLIVVGMLAVMVFAIIVNTPDAFASLH